MSSEAIVPNNNPAQADSDLQVWKAPKRDRWLALRNECITSTEMAPVAGIPKYGNTRFSIYHVKRGELEDAFVPSERSDIGLDIEHAIAKMTKRKIDARVLKLADFMRRESLGASFDYQVVEPEHELNQWLVEIKNVDYLIFKDQWEKDSEGRFVPPEHITVQVQAQLEVSRRPGCLLSVLVGGNDLHLIKIARDAEFGAALRQIANEFWADIEAGNVPDVVADDAANAARLYSFADPSKIIDASQDFELSHQIASYKALKEKAKSVEAEAATIKAQVLVSINDVAKVFGSDGYTLDAGITKATAGKIVTPDMVGTILGARKEFRRFTVRKNKH